MKAIEFLLEFLGIGGANGLGGAIIGAIVLAFFIYKWIVFKRDYNEISIKIKEIDIKDVNQINAEFIQTLANKYNITDLPEKNRLTYLSKQLKKEQKRLAIEFQKFIIISLLAFLVVFMLFVLAIIFLMRHDKLATFYPIFKPLIQTSIRLFQA